MEKELSPARLTGFAGGLRRRYAVLAIAGAVLLIPAAAASAATKTTFAGTPPKGAIKGVPGFVTDNAFYPKRTEIHQGDKVAFNLLGFHTITLPAKGDQPPALFALDPATPVSGVKDAANVDFWFNGNPSVGVNPAAAGPAGGNVYDGTKLVGSGLPGDGPPKPYKVKFTKKGTYTVYCTLHPGMKGTIVVKGKKAHITTKKQDAKRIKKQSKAASKLAKKLVAGQGVPSGLTVKAGNDKKGIAAIAFFPGTKSVKVGEQVKFTMSDKSTETHNIAFAPQAYAQELAQSFIGPAGIDPRSAYPSQPPGTPLVVDGAVHGNGFVNTGMLDDVKATPLPKSAVVTFSKPGTYDYYCIVHGAEMKGQIEVTN
jgi:plastocyanin